MSIDKFIVLSAARTGSSNLIQCLNQHPDLNVYSEPFNMDYNGLDLSIFDFNIDPCDTLSNNIHNQICQKKYFNLAHQKYDGFKVLYCHVKNDIEQALNNIKVIHLIRKNRLASAISWFVAKETKIWTSHTEFIGNIYIPPEHFRRLLIYNKTQEERYLNKFTECTVFYEDNMVSKCNKIYEYINVKKFTIINNNNKRIKKPLSEIVENYDEILGIYNDV